MSYTTLKIRQIPAIFPAWDYEDVKFTFDDAEILPEAYTEIYQTEKKYSTVYESISRNQIVQSLYRKKYSLEFYVKESTTLSLAKVAGFTQCVLFDGSILNIQILEITYERVADTRNWVGTITFAVLEQDYKSLNSHLISDNIDTVLANSLTFASSKTISAEFTAMNDFFTIYTILQPSYSNSELQEKGTSQTGTNITNNSIDFRQINGTFILTELQQYIVKRYLARCDLVFWNMNLNSGSTASATIGSAIVNFSGNHNLTTSHYIRLENEIKKVSSITNPTTVVVDSIYSTSHLSVNAYTTTIKAEERILPEFTENELIDLYQFDMKFKYDKVNFTHF